MNKRPERIQTKRGGAAKGALVYGADGAEAGRVRMDDAVNKPRPRRSRYRPFIRRQTIMESVGTFHILEVC